MWVLLLLGRGERNSLDVAISSIPIRLPSARDAKLQSFVAIPNCMEARCSILSLPYFKLSLSEIAIFYKLSLVCPGPQCGACKSREEKAKGLANCATNTRTNQNLPKRLRICAHPLDSAAACAAATEISASAAAAAPACSFFFLSASLFFRSFSFSFSRAFFSAYRFPCL